jgi:hypothetical protein
MATAMDDNFTRENGLNDKTGFVLSSSSTSKKPDSDDVPDYNEAFPQLRSSTGQVDINRSNTFFTSAFPSSSQGNNSTGAMANTTTSLHSAAKNDEERRRKMAIHASSATTKIVSLREIGSI